MANSSNKTLHYRMTGEGHPIVFLHGFLLSSAIWDVINPDDWKGYQLIFIDLPGHGESREIKCPENISEITDQIIQVVGKENIEQFSIIGHSLGGYIAYEMMGRAQLKSKIQSCILLNSNFWEDPPEKKIERDRICKVVRLNHLILIREAIPHLFPEQCRKNHWEAINKYILIAEKMQPDNIINVVNAMKNRISNLDVLQEQSAKFLIIQGKLDHIVLPKKMIHFEKKMNKNLLIHYDDSGHMSFIENHPIIINEIIHHISKGIKMP